MGRGCWWSRAMISKPTERKMNQLISGGNNISWHRRRKNIFFLCIIFCSARQVLCRQPTELWLRWVPTVPSFHLSHLRPHFLAVRPPPPNIAARSQTSLLSQWFISSNLKHGLSFFHNYFLIFSICSSGTGYMEHWSKAFGRYLCCKGRKCFHFS